MTDNVPGRERHPPRQVSLNPSPTDPFLFLSVTLTPTIAFSGEK